MSKLLLMKLSIFAFVFFVCIAAPVCAGESTPQSSVESFLSSIRSMEFPIKDPGVQQKRAQEAAVFLDLEAMGKKALAEHWSSMTEAERAQFMDLFWKLIENIAYPRTKNFLGDQKILYQPEKVIERGVEVSSTVTDSVADLSVPVTYDLYEQDGQWKIYDILMDGISMTEDLSSQFDKMIAGGSVSILLARMSERLEKAEKANKEKTVG